jgi:N-formylmaleamate deformylase
MRCAVGNCMADLLPPTVRAALDDPTPGVRTSADVAGVPWSALTWGIPSDPALLLIHGVSSSAETWWRLGPALAASGRHVVAPDLPGHGMTGHWVGGPAIRDSAERVRAFAIAAGMARDLHVVGHSWGARLVAALPAVGLRPAAMVLLDPPAVPLSVLSEVAASPDEQHFPDLPSAVLVVRAANPAWSAADIEAKARALTQVDRTAPRSILLDNGDWDGGLADLQVPAAAGVAVTIIRGDPDYGGLLPEEWSSKFEAVIGPGRIHTVLGAPHSPHRTHPVEVTAAILEALS